MANININIRMDSDLKQQFEAFCNDVGMTMTTAFTVFAKKAVREYRIPFEIGAEVPNADTKKAIEDARKGIGMSKAFSSDRKSTRLNSSHGAKSRMPSSA